MSRVKANWPIVALAAVILTAIGCANDTGGSSIADSGGDVGADFDGGMDSSDAQQFDQSDVNMGADAVGGPISLEAGEAIELTLDAGFGSAVITTEGDEQFMLVLGSTRFDYRGDDYDYALAIGDDVPEPSATTALDGCSLSDEEWRNLVPPNEDEPSGEPPEIDDVREFVVATARSREQVEFQVVAVGEGAVVWEDISEDHPAELDDEFVAEFLADFEDLILPRERAIFGVESDIDGDGRIALLFTPLTYDTAVAFFSGCDLLPDSCSPSNGAEVLYLTPPNSIAPPYNTPNAIKEILAHELQHLIHFNRSLLLNDLDEWVDNSYMLEGFGALAQDVSGYQAGNFYVTKAGLDLIDDLSMGDILADGGNYDPNLNGVLRGGAYLFVRWLYDRGGGDEALPDGSVESRGGPMLLRALMEAEESAAAALPEAAGSSMADLAMDFFTAVGASNRDDAGDTAPENPCFSYLPTVSDPVTERQRGANLFAGFHGQSMTGPATQPATSPDGIILAGGVEYLLLEVTAGQTETSFSVDVDPEAQARLRVVRIR